MINHVEKTRYELERRSLNRDLYYLFCIFAASKRLVEVSYASDASEFDMAWNLKLAYQYHEIQRLLLSVAIQYRVLYEQATPLTEGDPDYDIIGDFDWRVDLECVGDIWTDIPENKQSGKLEFREACNKIIHTEQMQFHEESFPDSNHKYLIPSITLHGTHHKKKWKANIDIEKFLQEAYKFTCIDPDDGI